MVGEAEPPFSCAPVHLGKAFSVPNAGNLNLAHDQTWHYRIDVSSAAAGETEVGMVYTIDTIKWIPEILGQPQASVVGPIPSVLTIDCVGGKGTEPR